MPATSSQLTYHVQSLDGEFKRRISKNPRYSLRAFASFLGLHPSALSRVLAGKQDITPRAGLQIVSRLGFDAEQKRLFLQSIVDERRDREAAQLGSEISSPALRPSPIVIDSASYARIFNLKAHAILQLTLSEEFQSDHAWIANQLGFMENEVSSLIASLLELGLLANENGQLVHTNRLLTAVNEDETSDVRRNYQKSILERAIVSLEKDAFKRRSHCGVMMSIDPEKLPKAQDLITKFMENLCDVMESGTSHKEVYQFSLQLFPLSLPSEAISGTSVTSAGDGP